jgi:hypothetical protein
MHFCTINSYVCCVCHMYVLWRRCVCAVDPPEYELFRQTVILGAWRPFKHDVHMHTYVYAGVCMYVVCRCVYVLSILS